MGASGVPAIRWLRTFPVIVRLNEGMRAIAVAPGKRGVRVVERPEPEISAPDEVKLKVVSVGICGTDREEAAGGRALAPEGQADLVIGHEMLGQVVDAGAAVERVKKGDYAVFTVRRPCGQCLPCTMLRPDMCRTGKYRERGIWGLDGYQTEFVVDRECWITRVPPRLASIGVLAEPMSVVEKAIQEAERVQFVRLPDAGATPDWLAGRRCLVAGLGPIGLLAAMLLRLRGARVFGLDVVDSGTARPQWLEHIGGGYVDGRNIGPRGVENAIGAMDLIVEATGVPKLAFNLLEALAPGGIIALTGIPGGTRMVETPGGELLRSVVLSNTLMFGSVNAARDHFHMGVNDLEQGMEVWGKHVERLITHRAKVEEAEGVLAGQPAEEIKTIVEWC
jgi:threonine dehydrogenase-like Zn-dependent dehydrogenase